MLPPFTLVSTVFNERQRLLSTLSDLQNQSQQPSEIIITDAGSTDGTYEMLIEFAAHSAVKVIILQEARCNVARGRNLAIKAASTDLILSTDFGCRFHPDWIKSIMTPFVDPDVHVVGGAYSVVEDELTSDPEKVGYLLSNGYQVDANASYFIPSSRSIAYRRQVFEKIGGYCEWLTLAADDLIFGMQIRSLGIPIHIVKQPYVYWGRHRSYQGYAKETFRYGLGDGEARIKFKQFFKYLVFLVFRAAFLGIILLSAAVQEFNMLWFNSIFIIGFIPYYHHVATWLRLRSPKYNFAIFLKGFYLLELTHLHYIKGYIKGFYFSGETKRTNALELKKKLVSEYSTL